MNRKNAQVIDKKCTAGTPDAAAETPPSPDPGDLMAVVNHYQSPLLRYVGRMLGSIDNETEDIVQEVFIRLHRQVARKGPKSVRHLTTWLFKTAHNLTIDIIRKRSRRKKITTTSSDDGTTIQQHPADELDALSEVLRQEARQVTLRELAKLDEKFRQVLLLKIIQGMTLRQVAEVIGISVSLVNYRLNHGLAELSKRLQNSGVV